VYYRAIQETRGLGGRFGRCREDKGWGKEQEDADLHHFAPAAAMGRHLYKKEAKESNWGGILHGDINDGVQEGAAHTELSLGGG